MTVIKVDEEVDSAVDVALALLRTGGVMVYPTDTVYGIGGDAESESVVRKIHEIKGIQGRRPMSVMVSDFGMIEYYCETGLWEDMILGRYLPGPYTFILKKNPRRYLPASPDETIGVRIPDSAFCQELCRRFGKPVISTSANITKGVPATKLSDVDRKVLDSVPLAVDGGQTKYRSPSVIVDLVQRKIMREGASEAISLVSLPES
ncbi:MAG: L-threonylcarbamoyladenylate synthase [Candidatus Micrarchaeota archaeon]